jgi:hypothetical protein
MPASAYAKTLPEPEELRHRCQVLAVLDAILCPEWEYRYFSFNSHWAPGEMLASMRNGEGDDWLLLWNAEGAVLKGFAHTSAMARNCPWPGVLDDVPTCFRNFLDEPAFSAEQTTFCLWRLHSDDGWQVGKIDYPEGEDPDGSDLLLHFLDGKPETYQEWAEAYFGSRPNLKAIEHLYDHQPLNPFIVRSLNTEVRLDELRGEIEDIGFPL